MLAAGNSAELKEFCEAIHPAATADFMAGLTADEAWQVLRQAQKETRSQIFNYFDPARKIEIIETQNREEIADLLQDLAPDDRVDLLNAIGSTLGDQLVELLPAEERRETLRLQSYPEGTAGAVMTTEVARLDESLTVREALEELSKSSPQLETIYYLYVVDDSGHLRGVLSARDLISSLSSPNRRLREIMETEPITVHANDDQEEVARKVAYYDLLAIPVVDEQHRMLGIITHDDVIDVVREEATEDAHLIGGVHPLEAGYLQTGVTKLWWNRGIWLAPLFFAELLTAKAIKMFEQPLSSAAWLVAFMPLVISSGGNSGNQSATLIITGLTTGDIKLRDWLLVVGRELLMGLLLGGLLALMFLPIGWLIEPEITSWRPALVVPFTLVLIVICGTLCGSVLPLIFKRLGQDPALMSNPFVAGIVDVVGIVIYVTVAMMLLGR
jgi:magnesium transporter